MIKAISIFCCLVSTSVFASSQNFSGSMGVGGGVAVISIDDPSGSTGSAAALYPSFIYIFDISRDTRVLSEFAYYDFDLDASTSEIGQNVTSFSLAGIYEWRQRLGRNFKPWFGVGLGFGSDSSKARHTIDGGGFLDSVYADRDESGVSVIIDASVDIKISDADLLLRGAYTIPTYDGVRGFGLSLIYLF